MAKDLLKEYEKFDEKKVLENGSFEQSSRFKKFVHKTLNGKMVSCDIGYERFLGPEMFFHPVSYLLVTRLFYNTLITSFFL